MDENKVRKCDKNIAQMSILEYIKHDIISWGYFKNCCYELKNQYIETITNLFYVIINTILFILSPITLIFCAIARIKQAKRNVKKWSKVKW